MASAPRRAAAHAATQAERLANVSAKQVASAPGKAGDAPVIPLFLMTAGGYLLWFAVHYFGQSRSGGGILWPTDPVKAVLQGRAIPAPGAGSAKTPSAGQLLAGETNAVNAAEQAATGSQFGGGNFAGGGTGGSGPGDFGPGGGNFSGGPGAGGTYSHAQLVALWQQAGGSPSTARNAACHAMQESSGRAAVTSSNPYGGTNVGLWQLDTRGVGAGHTVAQLQDPLTNARLTVMHTRNGTNWAQWATPGC